jgi:hypothetical protein
MRDPTMARKRSRQASQQKLSVVIAPGLRYSKTPKRVCMIAVPHNKPVMTHL